MQLYFLIFFIYFLDNFTLSIIPMVFLYSKYHILLSVQLNSLFSLATSLLLVRLLLSYLTLMPLPNLLSN